MHAIDAGAPKRDGNVVQNRKEKYMTKISKQVQALEDAVAHFVQSFELVFHNDWDLTVSSVGN